MRFAAFPALGLLTLAACGGSSTLTPDSGAQPEVDTGTPAVDAGHDAFAPFDSGPFAGSCQTLTFPTEHVADGVENTQCVIVDLGNDLPIHVGSIRNHLPTASHHFIVYRASADAVETTTPFDCTPFVDTLSSNSGSPLMITQRTDELLTLPPGIAYTLPAHQLMRLELHYINTTGAAVDIAPTSQLCPITDAEYTDDADFLFVGDPDIHIPAHGTFTLGPVFYPLASSFSTAHFFAITGHEHRLGTNVVVQTGPAAGPFTDVYNVAGFSWQEPEVVSFPTPFQIPAGGGFNFTCDWENPTADNVGFGESANDEMCFFWAYYYPARPNAPHVCVHTAQAGGHDICCPGDALCSLISSRF